MSNYNHLGYNDLDEVILVNQFDQVVGQKSKIQAHLDGDLHRAFSVFIFDETKSKVMLQQRASNKYHSANLWTNTVCSHPRVGEDILTAASRRLMEEMGINDVVLYPQFHFIYKVQLENQLIENELDHVIFGFTNQEPKINQNEVKDWQWVNINELNLKFQHEELTEWFKISWSRVLNQLRTNNG